MFGGQEDEGLLICLVCRTEFEEVAGRCRNIILPCGHSLCKVCYDRVVDRLNHSIKCTICKILHTDIKYMDETSETPSNESTIPGSSSSTTPSPGPDTAPQIKRKSTHQQKSRGKQTKLSDFFSPVSRIAHSSSTASLVSALSQNISTDGNNQEGSSDSSFSGNRHTPCKQYTMPPPLVFPKPVCVISNIQSYITCATREFEKEMIQLSVFCYGQDIKTWHINTNTFTHPSHTTTVSLATALTNLRSWLSKPQIVKPLLIVGHTDFYCLLKAMEKEKVSSNFKSVIEGFTDTRRNIFKDKSKKIESLKDIAFDILGNQSIFNKENENDPKTCANALALMIEKEIHGKGRTIVLEHLATHSRDFENVLEYSRYMNVVDANLRFQFENISLDTLIKRKKLRKDLGEKIAQVGFTYKDICLLHRYYGKEMIIIVFKVHRKITDSQTRVEAVIEMLNNIERKLD